MFKARKSIRTIISILLIFMMNFSQQVYAKEPYIKAKAAIALDVSSKVVLYEKNAATITSIASTTKIMTALAAIKYGELEKPITISAKAAAIKGSTVG